MTGGTGDDTMTGGTGDDTMTGGTGDDTMTGGTGDDTFVFAAGDGSDTITDFTDGEDPIDLSAFSAISGFSDLTINQDGDDTVIDLGAPWRGRDHARRLHLDRPGRDGLRLRDVTAAASPPRATSPCDGCARRGGRALHQRHRAPARRAIRAGGCAHGTAVPSLLPSTAGATRDIHERNKIPEPGRHSTAMGDTRNPWAASQVVGRLQAPAARTAAPPNPGTPWSCAPPCATNEVDVCALDRNGRPGRRRSPVPART